MSDSRQQPTGARGSLKRQFYQALGYLAREVDEEALDRILGEAGRLLDIAEAEALILSGWEEEGRSMP